MVASAYCASGIAGFGGDAEQFGGAGEILRELLALEIEQAEIVGGGGMTELGGGGEPFGASLAVARPGAASKRTWPSANMAFAVAARGGELVPFRGLGVVAGTPSPLA